jgi:hypothetical protein
MNPFPPEAGWQIPAPMPLYTVPVPIGGSWSTLGFQDNRKGLPAVPRVALMQVIVRGRPVVLAVAG